MWRVMQELAWRYRPRWPWSARLDRIEAMCDIIADDIYLVLKRIRQLMATEQETLDKLNALGATLTKVSGETSRLLAEIATLREQIVNLPTIPQSVLAKIDEITGIAGNIDALVPDAPEG